MAVLATMPQLRTTNIEASIDFFVDTMGFELEFRYEDFYAGINLGSSSIHLKLVDEPDPSIQFVSEGGHIHLYIEVDDIESFVQRLESKGVSFHLPLRKMPWGPRECQIKDSEGHIICIAQGE